MATKTVLYLGFSFSDEYINEVRSGTMMMLGQAAPIAYAIVNDKSETQMKFYVVHEGVRMINYNTSGPGSAGWAGFDNHLQTIHDHTNPVVRWAKAIMPKRILWCLGDSSYEHCGMKDLVDEVEARSSEKLDVVVWTEEENCNAVEWAIDKIKKERFHLLITDYVAAEKKALTLLRKMRKVAKDKRCPVIVFSNPTDLEKRKAVCLQAGAKEYVTRIQTLLWEMHTLLAPAQVTS